VPTKQRDYSNLKESERVFDAVKLNSTHFKDYSLTHLCSTAWRMSDPEMLKRLVRIRIGDREWIGHSPTLANEINELADNSNEDNWFPQAVITLTGEKGKLTIDTQAVSDECLQDHMAHVTIDGDTAIVDLEELLKATRYA
jgi:hypothetical protein